jgi:hypothetical protein
MKMYTDILRRFRDAVRRKRLENGRTKSWFLHNDLAPAHRTGLLKDFLAQSVIKNETKELKRISQNGFQERI